MNRTLLCLGLANNKIGDVGANKFADVRIRLELNGSINGSRYYFCNYSPSFSRGSSRLTIRCSDWRIFVTVLMTSRIQSVTLRHDVIYLFVFPRFCRGSS